MPETIASTTEQTKPTEVKSPPKYYKKTQAALAMLDAGIKPEVAVQLLNNTNKPARSTVSLLKAKHRKHSLQSPKMVKLAHNAVRDCLTDQPITSKRVDKKGNEIVEEIPPTWTNKIAAASMVYDRVEPIVRQNLNVNANMDVHPVDLSRWLNVQSGGDDGQMPTSDADYVDITSDQSDPQAK